MCRTEKDFGVKHREGLMGFKTLGESRVEKLKNSMATSSRSRMKLWMIRATTSVLLWTCIVQLTAFGNIWGPRVLKGWPSCFSHDSAARVMDMELPSVPVRVLPPKSEFCSVYLNSHTDICLFVWRNFY